MTLLAIDTAHGQCSVALAEGGKTSTVEHSTLPSKQAEELLNLIQTLLAKKKLSFANVEKVAVCIGPGSFTGVRIGISAAQGLCFSKNIPLIGITALEAIADNYQREATNKGNFMVAINAQRGQAYTQIFKNSSEPASEPLLQNIEDVCASAEESGAVVITGNCSALLKSLPKGIAITDDVFYTAENIAAIAEKKLTENAELPNAIPLYIREPDAKLPKSKTSYAS